MSDRAPSVDELLALLESCRGVIYTPTRARPRARPSKRARREGRVEQVRRSRFAARGRAWAIWTDPRDGEVITVDEAIRRYVEDHEKLRGTWMVDAQSIRPFIEYHWSREHHRDGTVPSEAGGKVYMRDTYHGRFSEPSEAQLERLREHGEAYAAGNRWDAMVRYMRSRGWDRRNPAQINIDLLGRAKLGEGNHRLGVALEVGLPVVPVEFIYVDRVSWSKERF